VRALVLVLLLPGTAWAQTADPIVTTVTQEWQSSETSRGHLAEAVQKLAEAYIAQTRKAAEVDAYWKAYVGLSPADPATRQQESKR
jgi:hypothetical protein